MSGIVFIGDVHGKVKQYRKIIRALPEGSKSLQIGDFGLGFKGVHLFPGGSLTKGTHRFIRGNHDDPARCRKHPLYLGDYGYLPEERLFYLGGAWSIDQQWRTPQVSWWPDEELSVEELNKAHQLYIDSKPQIVATHEAPSVAAILLLSWAQGLHVSAPKMSSPNDPPKGEDYAYFKAKMGCVNTRTSQALQQMFEVHQPKYWIFGHYHLTCSFVERGTEFQCLGELATREIEL